MDAGVATSTDRAPSIAGMVELAAQVRADCVRAVHHARGGHLGGPLSCAERYKLNNLTAILDFDRLQQYGRRGKMIKHRTPPRDS